MSTDGGLEQTTMASQCAAEVEGTVSRMQVVGCESAKVPGNRPTIEGNIWLQLSVNGVLLNAVAVSKSHGDNRQ
jgi:hypothetical protein